MRIAIISPLGDFGIDQYTYELAEGLAANATPVDVYSSHTATLPPPRAHSRYAVLGAPLFRSGGCNVEPAVADAPLDRPVDWSRLALGQADAASITSVNGAPVHQQVTANRSPGRVRAWIRGQALDVELAIHLARKGYDIVWTQWPMKENYGARFTATCRRLGMRVVHTVHNVLPHDSAGTIPVHESRLYRCADRLILHSEYSRDIFLTHHSEAKSRVVVSPHGLYTMFQSSPNARSRVRNALGIGDGTVVFLFCGAIRPYKNVDAVIAALKDPKCKDAIVVIAGRESHYPDSDPSDPLGRCRRLAIEHGVAERLRFVPAHLDIQAISDLFEAGDAVLLPYIESYGSGMLLMGMTFGKFVLTTAVGGAGEYLKDYTSRCIISGPGTGEVLAGMADVIGRVKAAPCPSKVVAPGRLLWANISRALIDDLKALVRPSRKCVRRQNEP